MIVATKYDDTVVAELEDSIFFLPKRMSAIIMDNLEDNRKALINLQVETNDEKISFSKENEVDEEEKEIFIKKLLLEQHDEKLTKKLKELNMINIWYLSFI